MESLKCVSGKGFRMIRQPGKREIGDCGFSFQFPGDSVIDMVWKFVLIILNKKYCMSDSKNLTTEAGAPVPDNQNVLTAGPRGPMLLQDVWFLEKLAHFDREVIPERRMHAKGSGAFGTFTVTHDITRYTKAALFSEVGKKTDLLVRFSTVAGERGAADAERDIRGLPSSFIRRRATGTW